MVRRGVRRSSASTASSQRLALRAAASVEAKSERALVERLLDHRVPVDRAQLRRPRATRRARVAEAIGARHFELDVDALVDGYVSLVEHGDRPRAQLGDATTSRCRTSKLACGRPSVWMLANLDNALLLSTSNRSEAAVGYATMDGDTARRPEPDRRHRQGVSAALAALARDAKGPQGLGPIPALAAVTTRRRRPPSCGPPAPVRPTKRT